MRNFFLESSLNPCSFCRRTGAAIKTKFDAFVLISVDRVSVFINVTFVACFCRFECISWHILNTSVDDVNVSVVVVVTLGETSPRHRQMVPLFLCRPSEAILAPVIIIASTAAVGITIIAILKVIVPVVAVASLSQLIRMEAGTVLNSKRNGRSGRNNICRA